MGPKYEFTGETKNFEGRIVHRIRRLINGQLGGWIGKEDNLSQEGNCWVDDEAVVCDDAKVYGNARIYGNGFVGGNAKVYNNATVFDYAQVGDAAKVYGNALVCCDAKVYDSAKVYDNAEVYDNVYIGGYVQVYGNAKVYDNAELLGNVKVCGNTIVDYDISSGTVGDDSIDEDTEVLKDFVYKIDNSSKLDVQSSYDSLDDFFEDDSSDSYVEHECLTIIAVDTKVPILTLEKTQIKDKNMFKFVVDITNDDGDDYRVRSIIDSKDKLDQLLQSTIEALKLYPQFSKYVDDLENCL